MRINLFDPIDVHRSLLLFKAELPVDTGNMRHNATKAVQNKFSYRIYIDHNIAYYVGDVHTWYLIHENHDFMFSAMMKIARYLKHKFGGTFSPIDNINYRRAMEEVSLTSQTTARGKARRAVRKKASYKHVRDLKRRGLKVTFPDIPGNIKLVIDL